MSLCQGQALHGQVGQSVSHCQSGQDLNSSEKLCDDDDDDDDDDVMMRLVLESCFDIMSASIRVN